MGVYIANINREDINTFIWNYRSTPSS